ncbi:hypothetical protein TanjilG_08962 [Lupinus angustifolius]|uniref:Uncharacterized protein n=1 Tax=Lupinus angustifolius TaxID=3871 RepID=A0A4P1QP75_LUPAN|nr:hypothetical protein TanjilG_08962 [Lupinus angustifolius]
MVFLAPLKSGMKKEKEVGEMKIIVVVNPSGGAEVYPIEEDDANSDIDYVNQQSKGENEKSVEGANDFNV